MWGSAIKELGTGAVGGVETPAEDESRPRIGLAILSLLVPAAALGLVLLPVVVGIGVLMGRTVTLGLGIGFGVAILAGFKFVAIGFGLVGGVLSRPVDTLPG